MKTDDFIDMLATGNAPQRSAVVASRFAGGLGCGLMGTTMLLALLFGVRADIAQAATLPMFWAKISLPAVGALTALALTMRLSCPGRPAGPAPLVLAALLLFAWGCAGVALLDETPAQRTEMIFGLTWKTCAFNIALLALPIVGAAFWVIQGLAPARPAWTGASAGLLAGASAASLYALHCPEMAAPFLGIWYVLGIAIPTVLGALLGPRIWRW